MRTNIFDRLSFLVLFLVIVLLPVFFLPFTNIPIETSKGLLLVLGLVACVVFWVIARFIDGKIIFPKSWLLVSGFGIVFVFLLSALFSQNSQVSLFGVMIDTGSFWFIFSAFILMLFSSIVFRTPKQVKIVLFGAILSSVVVLIFQTVHLFIPDVLSLGVLVGKADNFVGSWNTLGLFAGFSGLMFLLMIEFFAISRIEKILLEISILLSILVAISVSFPLVWVLLGISSLIIFVYKASIAFQRNDDEEVEVKKKHFPLISFVVVMISLLFFTSGKFINNIIPDSLRVANTEVSLFLGTTLSITKGVLIKNPVLGIGPNRFEEAWSMYKPLAITSKINGNDFWDVSFNSGSGLLPTFTATTGGLGILAWIVFFVLFLAIGVKSLFSNIKNGVNWETMASFVLSLYLFVSSFFYSTGPVILLLAFAFAGVFIGLSASKSSNGEISLSFLNDHRKSFFSMLFMILIIIVSASISFKYIERLTSVSYFRKALAAQTVPLAEDYIKKTLSLYSNDLYLRTYSQIYLLKLNSIANKGSSLSDADKADLQKSFDQAINSAQMAVNYNPSNYLNYKLLGSVYQAVGSLGVKDAYNKAVPAFQDASRAT